MVTTNTASPHQSSTYSGLRKQAEKLFGIAKELETLARAKSEFYDDVEFLKWKAAYRKELEELISYNC